jgi:membrane protein insertase Oxa1/YidC/SpoIIIJ
MEFYKEHNVNPLGSCLPELIAAVGPSLPALWTPRHQTLPERLAGIVTVRDQRR